LKANDGQATPEQAIPGKKKKKKNRYPLKGSKLKPWNGKHRPTAPLGNSPPNNDDLQRRYGRAGVTPVSKHQKWVDKFLNSEIKFGKKKAEFLPGKKGKR